MFPRPGSAAPDMHKMLSSCLVREGFRAAARDSLTPGPPAPPAVVSGIGPQPSVPLPGAPAARSCSSYPRSLTRSWVTAVSWDGCPWPSGPSCIPKGSHGEGTARASRQEPLAPPLLIPSPLHMFTIQLHDHFTLAISSQAWCTSSHACQVA